MKYSATQVRRILRNNFTIDAETLFHALLVAKGPPPKRYFYEYAISGYDGVETDSSRCRRRDFVQDCMAFIIIFAKAKRKDKALGYCWFLGEQYTLWWDEKRNT